MNFTLARVAGVPNSTKSEIRDENGKVISPALERGAVMARYPRMPAGEYRLAFRQTPSKFDGSFRALLTTDYHGVIMVCDVPGRSAIEIHPANTFDQLEGCVAPGPVRDDQGEFHIPGGQSTPAFKQVYLTLAAAMLAGPVTLTVVDEDGPPAAAV